MDLFPDHVVTTELVRGRELVSQLRASLRDGRLDSIDALIEEISGSFTNAIKILSSREVPVVQGTKDAVLRGKSCTRSPKQRYRSRECLSSQQLLSTNPSEDGYIWKKYGQKKIFGAKYPRNYFRCNQRREQGCQAIKQVQRTDDDLPMFQITYIGQHSCKSVLCVPQSGVDPSSPKANYMLSFEADEESSEQWRDWLTSFSTLKQECSKVVVAAGHHASQQFLVHQEAGSVPLGIQPMDTKLEGLLEPRPFHMNEMFYGDVDVPSARNLYATMSSPESVTASKFAEHVSL